MIGVYLSGLASSATRGFVRFVNVRDCNGTTPLHLAARAGHVGVLRLLLENGALVSASTATTGYYAVTSRIVQNNLCVWYIAYFCGFVAMPSPGHGSTPLQFAAYGGSVDCITELLAWGADRSHRNIAGYVPNAWKGTS